MAKTKRGSMHFRNRQPQENGSVIVIHLFDALVNANVKRTLQLPPTSTTSAHSHDDLECQFHETQKKITSQLRMVNKFIVLCDI